MFTRGWNYYRLLKRVAEAGGDLSRTICRLKRRRAATGIFEKREEECRKVITVPGATSAQASAKQATGAVSRCRAALSQTGKMKG